MKNKSKIITLVIIILISIGGLVLKGYFDDEIYVLNDKNSQANEVNKDLKLEENESEIKKNTNNTDNEVSQKNSEVSDGPIDNKKITIYITGEVKKPGTIEIENDKRLADAIDLLGGLTSKADLESINLAIRLKDEMHYTIPEKGSKNKNMVNDENINNNQDNEDDNQYNTNNNQGNQNIKDSSEDKININLATTEELDSLPGIGEITAQKIIDYREENKKFEVVEEVKNVKGIGDKKYGDIKDLICVE